jgi:hypothetical protein
MTAPAIVDATWPRNSSQRLSWDKWTDEDDALLTSATMVFQMYDSAGATIGASVNGTHLGAGAWRIVVPALNLNDGEKYRATVTVTAPGGSRYLEWWVRATEDRPAMVP